MKSLLVIHFPGLHPTAPPTLSGTPRGLSHVVPTSALPFCDAMLKLNISQPPTLNVSCHIGLEHCTTTDIVTIGEGQQQSQETMNVILINGLGRHCRTCTNGLEETNVKNHALGD